MSDPTRSAGQMVKMFSENTALMERLKTDPSPIPVLEDTATKAEAEVDKPAWWKDKLFYYIVVSVLGLLALISAISSVILTLVNKTTPEVLVALGSAAVGALAGIFAPSPVGK